MGTRPQNRYKPSSRFWHIATSLKEMVYIRGGNTPDFSTESCKQRLSGTLEQFDPVNDVWHQLITRGTPHPGLSAVACASFGGCLYAYGGYDGEQLQGTLSKLDLKTLMWSQLSHEEAESSPMKKDASGMVWFHNNKLALIGGYAQPTGPIQLGSSFVSNELFTDGTGWTNEFHVFDISLGIYIYYADILLYLFRYITCSYKIIPVIVLEHIYFLLCV